MNTHIILVEIEYVKSQILTIATFVVSRQMYGTVVYSSFHNHVNQGGVYDADVEKCLFPNTWNHTNHKSASLIQANQKWRKTCGLLHIKKTNSRRTTPRTRVEVVHTTSDSQNRSLKKIITKVEVVLAGNHARQSSPNILPSTPISTDKS
jgi:hypothetical protein